MEEIAKAMEEISGLKVEEHLIVKLPQPEYPGMISEAYAVRSGEFTILAYKHFGYDGYTIYIV